MRLAPIAAAALAALGGGSCTSPRQTPGDAEVSVLRVSTHFGIAPIEPGSRAGITAHLTQLVYLDARRHFASLQKEPGRTWLLRPHGGGPASDELASAVRHPALVAALSTPDGVEVELRAAATPSLGQFTVALGPFRATQVTSDRLVLERRSGEGIDVIDVRAMATEEEEWRRFLAREVDMVPFASAGHLRYLSEIPSVRVVPVAQPASAALIFNVASPALADVRVRRAIARGLRRRAIAQVVTGDPAAAALDVEDPSTARALLAERRAERPMPPLRLVVHEPATDFQRAALVVQQQLAELGIDVKTRTLSSERVRDVFRSGDWDAFVFYGGYDERHWPKFRAGERSNYLGYANPRFDQAVARGASDEAIAILAQDVPLTPLYVIHEGVAIDRRFCGARPRVMFDLSWLADVHLCAPGEVE